MSVFVIRTQEVERTRAFFEKLGLAFVQEQHGDGPIHFACEQNGVVFEIYPTGSINSCRFIEPKQPKEKREPTEEQMNKRKRAEAERKQAARAKMAEAAGREIGRNGRPRIHK